MTGRDTELQYLETFYKMEQSNFIVMYGQQGVGKTTLLKKFMQGKDSLYYLSSPCSAKEQQYLFARNCEKKKDTLPIYPSYTECYEYILHHNISKKVLVIDEFVLCLKYHDTFVQELIQLMQKHKIMIILCSSMTSFIENDFVIKIGMLALQISGFLKVRQFRFHTLCKLFPKISKKDAYKYYAILGGIPAYWKLVDPASSFEENVKKRMLTPFTYLYGEGERIVARELREASVYNTILMKLAAGMNKLNDIHECTSFSRAKISVYLKNLMELEIVEKIFSFDTNGKENTQKGIYRIQNHFVSFWYRYVYPNFSALEMMDTDTYYDKFLKEDVEQYCHIFDHEIFHDYLDWQNDEGKLPFHYERSGEWVGKLGTIDMVASDEAGHMLVGSCNWHAGKMSFEDYEWLELCMKQARIKTAEIYLFSLTGFDRALEQMAESQENIHLIQKI